MAGSRLIPALAVSACILLALPALAETPIQGPDQESPVLLTADQVDYDRENRIVNAVGNVEVSQNGRVLKADKVSYNQATGVVTANGNVSVTEPTGEIFFANSVELTKEMREGVIDNIRMLFPDDTRFAANGAVRAGGNRTELSKGVFSPCKLCEDDPTKAPLWQIKSDRIIHDQANQRIEHFDATMEIFGMPVGYLPYFWHPDPTVERQSGFLFPSFGSSSQLGQSVETPYYLLFSRDWDATFAPVFYSDDRPVMAGEVRHRLKDGEINFSGSITPAKQRDDAGREEGGTDVRGHVFADGRFDFDETWRGGFDVALSLDDTYLRLYNINSEDSLTNRAYVEGFRGRSYALAEGYYFQGLRERDEQENIPIVAPFVSYNYVSDPLFLGSRVSLDTSALVLSREEGVNTRRLSAVADWQLPYIGPLGSKFTFTGRLQTDLYWVNAVPQSKDNSEDFSGLKGRFFPQAILDWRYPLVRDFGNVRQLIEPRATVIFGANGQNPSEIPNEDSLDFEFDDTNLFAGNRFPGVDRVDSGSRAVYGLRTAFYGDAGGETELFFGQSFRFRQDDLFTVGTGLDNDLSDFVGRVRIQPAEYFSLNYRFRIDQDEFIARRNELTLSAGPSAIRATLSYLFLDENTDLAEFGEREEIAAGITVRVTENWQVYGRTRWDLAEDGGALEHGGGITYQDECVLITADYARKFFRDRDFRPSNEFFVRVVFKHLGEITTN